MAVFQTRFLIKNKRFDDGTRMSVETSQSGSESYTIATFTDVKHYDTGSVDCVDQSDQSIEGSVYVFVNGKTQYMHIIISKLKFGSHNCHYDVVNNRTTYCKIGK